jgi:Cytochrome b562
MKKLLLPVLCLFLTLSPAISRAEGDKPKHEDTELGKSMDKLNKAWRKLRKQAADPAQNANSLELLVTIKAATHDNLKYTPDLARDIPADKRDKFIAGYQAKMKEVIAAFDQLEAALKANDNKAAGEIIAKIGALQKEGHKEYKRPD